MTNNVRAFLRIRGQNENENKNSIVKLNDQEIILKWGKQREKSKKYKFNRVYDEVDSSEQMATDI